MPCGSSAGPGPSSIPQEFWGPGASWTKGPSASNGGASPCSVGTKCTVASMPCSPSAASRSAASSSLKTARLTEPSAPLVTANAGEAVGPPAVRPTVATVAAAVATAPAAATFRRRVAAAGERAPGSGGPRPHGGTRRAMPIERVEPTRAVHGRTSTGSARSGSAAAPVPCRWAVTRARLRCSRTRAVAGYPQDRAASAVESPSSDRARGERARPRSSARWPGRADATLARHRGAPRSGPGRRRDQTAALDPA